MKDDFNGDKRSQVEGWLGRPLQPAELITVASLADLTPAQLAVVKLLADKHRLACLLYLDGVVRDVVTHEALTFINKMQTVSTV